jgi:Ser/Thr protein kinase RdoA (MazF antagonist)
MKPYNELTRLGQLRRMRKLAEAALQRYGLSNATLTFQHYEGNVIFRVDVPGDDSSSKYETFVPNRYNMRILSMNDPEATVGELTWLAALCKGTGLPVPEPVPTLDGKLFTTVMTPGVPQGRLVSMMRWVDGQQLSEKSLRSHHVRSWGKMVGQLHTFAVGWTPPKGYKRFQWDWEGILGNGFLCTPVDELVARMPQKYQKPFEIVSSETRKAMDALGKGPEAYGIVHIDMYLENVLFKGGEARLIDFEDCGFGYYAYDLGIILSQWFGKPEMDWFREVFFEGYAETNSLAAEQYEYIDLFIATRFADFTLWGTSFIKNDPARAKEHEAWRNESGDSLVRYFQELKL